MLVLCLRFMAFESVHNEDERSMDRGVECDRSTDSLSTNKPVGEDAVSAALKSTEEIC